MAAPPGVHLHQQRTKFYEERVGALLEYAEWDFRLERKRDDGASERDHLESAARQIANLPGWRGRKKAAEVVPEQPSYPVELDYLLRLYGEHCYALEQNGMGPAMVTWPGLRDWNEMMHHDLRPWELLAIARLGHLRAVVEGERMSKKMRDAGNKTKA